MPYRTKAIANYFLDLGETNGVPITAMKLQKLIYYAHAWHLALTGLPLIDSRVECWEYGPVVADVFHEFKEFGKSPITTRAAECSFSNDPETGAFKFDFSKAFALNNDEQAEVAPLLDRIWKLYGSLSATKLSNMTHVSGGPWSRVMEAHGNSPPKGTDIPDEYIHDYFKSQLKSRES